MKMKIAWFAAIVLLGTCLFCGCTSEQKGISSAPSAQSVAESVSRPFDATAKIKMGGIQATADLNRTEDGVCTFVFEEPKTLNGMTISLDKDTIGLSYKGLHVDADSEKVLNSSVTKAILTAVNAASEPDGITVSVDGSAILVNGATDAGEFTLKLDQKNRSMLTLSIPSLDLECNFGS